MLIQVDNVFDVRRLQLRNYDRDVIFLAALPLVAFLFGCFLERREVILVEATLLGAARKTFGRLFNIWLGQPTGPGVPLALPAVGADAAPGASLDALDDVWLVHVIKEAVTRHQNDIIFLYLVLDVVRVEG